MSATLHSPDQAVHEQASRWVVLHSGGETDAQAQAEFDAWYADDPRHAAAYDRLARLWRRMGDVPAAALARRRGKALRGTAAAALVAAAGGWFGWLAPPIGSDHASGAAVRQVKLPDGSLAILDAGAAIAVDYEAGNRRVRLLAGRALFQPRPRQPGMPPFTVETPEASATALGTRFTVERGDDATRVGVYEHQVEVRCLPCDADHALVLSPGESASVSRNGLERGSAPPGGDAPAWRDGRVDFDDVPLPQAAGEIGRYTNKAILIMGDARDQRVSGSTSIADPHRALSLLLAGRPVRISSLPGLLIVR